MYVMTTLMIVPYSRSTHYIHVRLDVITADILLACVSHSETYRSIVHTYADHCTRVCMLYQCMTHHIVHAPYTAYRNTHKHAMMMTWPLSDRPSKEYPIMDMNANDMYWYSMAEFLPFAS